MNTDQLIDILSEKKEKALNAGDWTEDFRLQLKREKVIEMKEAQKRNIEKKGYIVNGSLKGYDEYANLLNLPYQDPLQALFLVHQENIEKKVIIIPVHSELPKTYKGEIK